MSHERCCKCAKDFVWDPEKGDYLGSNRYLCEACAAPVEPAPVAGESVGLSGHLIVTGQRPTPKAAPAAQPEPDELKCATCGWSYAAGWQNSTDTTCNVCVDNGRQEIAALRADLEAAQKRIKELEGNQMSERVRHFQATGSWNGWD